MLFNAVLVSALATAAFAANTDKLAKMSLNQVFGVVGRQDAGYAPTQHLCGSGDTCQVACGADTAECPSTDGGL